MTANVQIIVERRENVLLVPNRAVRTQGRNRSVDLLVDRVDGVDFIVMEYVAGKTLDRLIPKQGMALGEVIVRQGDFHGPVVNLAARLAGAAEPGQSTVATATTSWR